TSKPSAASTRTVAALTSLKKTRWTQPWRKPTVPRRSPRAGVRSGSFANACRVDTRGASSSMLRRRGNGFSSGARRRAAGGPPAGRVHLLAPERVGRAGREAEATVDAVVDQLGRGRALGVPRGAHQMPPT